MRIRRTGVWAPGLLTVALLVCTVTTQGADPGTEVPGLRTAQAPSATGMIPVRIVNGRLIVLTDLVGLRYTNEASFEISFDYPDALTLHPDQFRWLGFDPNDLGLGDQQQIHVQVINGPRLSFSARDVAQETSEARLQAQNDMTKLFSDGLAERKLKGTIGIGLLRKYHLTLDIAAGQLILAPPAEPADPSAVSNPNADVVTTFDVVNDRIAIPIAHADGQRAVMTLGGTEYDSPIDTRVTTPLGKPAGNLQPIALTEVGAGARRLDLSRYLAFRPRRFGVAPTPAADSPLVIAGVNLLEKFRIEIDWTNQRIAWTAKAPPAYPQEDFAYFEAETAGTMDALEGFLKTHAESRLSAEAASLLMDRLLEREQVTEADVRRVLPWAVRTALPGRKTETLAAYVEKFVEQPGREALAIAVGKEALTYAREAFDARAVYALHHRLAQIYMAQQAWNDAWKHLLSAAFMAPEDMEIALDLARVYDKQGQARRAYSRYKQVGAAPGVPPEIAAEIKAALDRLRPQLPKDDPLLRGESTRGGRGGGGGGR